MRAHIADVRLVLKWFFGSRRRGALIFGVVFCVLQSNKIHGLDVISACGLTTRMMTMTITKKKFAILVAQKIWIPVSRRLDIESLESFLIYLFISTSEYAFKDMQTSDDESAESETDFDDECGLDKTLEED